MKEKTGRMVVLLVAVTLLAALAPAASFAKANKTHFVGTSCFDASGDPGIWTPLGNGAYRVVGMQESSWEDADDPRVAGYDTVTVNMILDMETGSGPVWGTFYVVNEQGSWTGHFSGSLNNWASSYHGTGHGSGAFEGLVARWTWSRPVPGVCYDTSGYIVETGAGE